jgi:exportin-1
MKVGIQAIIKQKITLRNCYPLVRVCSAKEQTFIQNLALFFTSSYKSHICIFETTPGNRAALVISFQIPLLSSMVDGLVSQLVPCTQLYTQPVLKKLELLMLMICHIAKRE